MKVISGTSRRPRQSKVVYGSLVFLSLTRIPWKPKGKMATVLDKGSEAPKEKNNTNYSNLIECVGTELSGIARACLLAHTYTLSTLTVKDGPSQV